MHKPTQRVLKRTVLVCVSCTAAHSLPVGPELCLLVNPLSAGTCLLGSAVVVYMSVLLCTVFCPILHNPLAERLGQFAL